MPNDAQPELEQGSAAVPGLTDAAFWAAQFSKYLEIEFSDIYQDVAGEVSEVTFRGAMTKAFLNVLAESGATPEEVARLMQAALPGPSPKSSGKWTDKKNARRLALIDKSIQKKLSLSEAVELSDLTNQLRARFDTEESMPLDGARRIHERLADLEDQASW